MKVVQTSANCGEAQRILFVKVAREEPGEMYTFSLDKGKRIHSPDWLQQASGCTLTSQLSTSTYFFLPWI